MMDFGLEERTINELTHVFVMFPEIEEIIVFGSRAKGTNFSGSDLDLAVKGEHVTFRIISKLREQLEELPIPLFVDILDYKNITNEDLRSHINRVGRPIYVRS